MTRLSGRQRWATMIVLIILSIGCAQVTSQQTEGLVGSFSYLSVPEVRGAEDSRQIEVAYLHLSGDKSGLTTFVFFGGPGESALDFGTLNELRNAHKGLLLIGDVVFVEQRGVGASRPRLDCGDIEFAKDLPLTREAVVRQHEIALDRCASEYQANMAGYSAEAIADDADAIRRHLGLDRINVVGGSFGARQTHVYVQRYGRHVNRAVMTQFLAPSTTLALPSTIDEYIFEIGERFGPRYGLGENAGQAFSDLVRQVYEQVEQVPVEVQVGEERIVIGRTDLEIVTALALRRTREAWMLPEIFLQLSAGDFDFVGGVAYQFFRDRFPVNAAVLGFDCAEQIASGRRDRFESEVIESISGYGAHLPFPYVCDNFSDAFQHQSAEPSDFEDPNVPILIIQGELDARARDENLTAILDANVEAHMLIIGNASHDLGRSVSPSIGRTVDGITADFLSRGRRPDVAQFDIPLPFAD